MLMLTNMGRKKEAKDVSFHVGTTLGTIWANMIYRISGYGMLVSFSNIFKFWLI